MPTYVVKRTTPVLASVTVDAASEDEARWFAQVAWVKDAKHAAILSEPERQPERPDDDGDARSEARYEYTDDDARDDAMREHRWGLRGAESPPERTEP
jgi:hypothetical protein